MGEADSGPESAACQLRNLWHGRERLRSRVFPGGVGTRPPRAPAASQEVRVDASASDRAPLRQEDAGGEIRSVWGRLPARLALTLRAGCSTVDALSIMSIWCLLLRDFLCRKH